MTGPPPPRKPWIPTYMEKGHMTIAPAASPTRNLTTRLGELKEQADRELANFCMTLKQIDDTCNLLAKHGLPQSVTLGQIGDAAAVVRRDLEKQKPAGFELPRTG